MTLQRPSSKQNDKSAIVIGAGIVGISCAWHLQRNGYAVVVLDRQLPGQATSWGNAGLIQRLPPSPIPRGFLRKVQLLLNSRNDAQYTIAGVMDYYYPLFLYWRNSFASTFNQIEREYSTLSERCTQEHEVMIREAKCEHLVRRRGFFDLFRTKTLQEIRTSAAQLTQPGLSVRVVTPGELKDYEPSVNVSSFSGGLLFEDAWQVLDPGALVKAYADHFVSKGGSVLKADVRSILRSISNDCSTWIVKTEHGNYEAPLVVVAAGPWSNEVLRGLGYRFPLFSLRGYNTHFHLKGDAVLNHAIVDVDNGFSISPMNGGVRVCTGMEVTSMASPPNHFQLSHAITALQQLLPVEGPLSKEWYGHRPCLPDMKPIISQASRHPGLWMCFGHGSNGLTLGPVSGRLLAEMVVGKDTFIDPIPFSDSRFL